MEGNTSPRRCTFCAFAFSLLAAEIVLLHLPEFLLLRYPMVWSGEKTDRSVVVLVLFKSDMNEEERLESIGSTIAVKPTVTELTIASLKKCK